MAILCFGHLSFENLNIVSDFDIRISDLGLRIADFGVTHEAETMQHLWNDEMME